MYKNGEGPWWLRIMGIGASTNVKEIRIDQNDAKWESYPSSAGSRRSSKSKGLVKRWINSAESAANNRRLQQLNCALETAEKKAQDAEQRIRQLERELATLELRNMELADETTWLKKQLSDRPEVPILERPPTGTLKNLATGASTSGGGDAAEAYRSKQAQYVSKLESQITLYEEDILKLKTKLSKETQRLQAELEDQKHRNEKEVRSLDNRLIEAHKLNQKYEEVISSKISPEAVDRLRNEVSAHCAGGTSASTVRAAACASASASFAGPSGDNLSQSKSRAQLILELTEQISVQQDKIRRLEDEINQRDIELSHLKVVIQRTDQGASSSEFQKSARSSAPSTRAGGSAKTARSMGTATSRKTVRSEGNAVESGAATPVVANEDEIEALLNNPTMIYEPESDEDKQETRHELEEDRTAINLSVSQDLQQQQQLMSASLRSVPTSWRKDPPLNASTTGAAALPPSGANPKRIINIVNSIDGNNLRGKIGSARPKTMASGRQRTSQAPPTRQTADEADEADENPDSKQSNENSGNQPSSGSRTHSAPMFSFKPRPSSKDSKRTALSTSASRMGHELPPPIDLEEPSIDFEQKSREPKKQTSKDSKKSEPSKGSRRKNSDSIEVLSLHDHDAAYGAGSESVLGYDSSNAAYDDEGDIEDEDEDQNPENGYNSDQEIRRKFEERWKKSTVDEPDPNLLQSRAPRPPAGGGVGQAAAQTSRSATTSSDQRHRERVTTSAKSQDSGFLGDSCASTNSLSLWKGRNKRQKSLQQAAYDPLDVDKLLEM